MSVGVVGRERGEEEGGGIPVGTRPLSFPFPSVNHSGSPSGEEYTTWYARHFSRRARGKDTRDDE